MKINKFIWLLLILGIFIVFTQGKFFNILGENLNAITYDTPYLLDQDGGAVFTPDSILTNVRCPGINIPYPGEQNCGRGIIWIDNKTYHCDNLKIEEFGKMCNVLDVPHYSIVSEKCKNPVKRSDGVSDPNYNYCITLKEQFGTISNPFNVGNHEFEMLYVFVRDQNNRILAHDIQTITIINNLRCGDSICTIERGEDNVNCAVDCPPPDCDDGVKNGNEIGIDCGGSCSACFQSEPGRETCIPSFVYGTWSACINGVQSRTYSDERKCNVPPPEPIQRSCIDEDPLNPPIIQTGLNTILIIVGIIIIIVLWWFLRRKR